MSCNCCCSLCPVLNCNCYCSLITVLRAKCTIKYPRVVPRPRPNLFTTSVRSSLGSLGSQILKSVLFLVFRWLGHSHRTSFSMHSPVTEPHQQESLTFQNLLTFKFAGPLALLRQLGRTVRTGSRDGGDCLLIALHRHLGSPFSANSAARRGPETVTAATAC